MLYPKYQFLSDSDNNALCIFLLTPKTNIQMFSYWNEVLSIALEMLPRQGCHGEIPIEIFTSNKSENVQSCK